jgi:hypothetical protein
MKMEMDI